MKKHTDTYDFSGNRNKVRRPKITWRCSICDRTITSDQEICNRCAAEIVARQKQQHQ